jgi:hypothetical protein
MEYSKFSVKELKNVLEKKGLKGVSKYKKDELINLLLKLENIEKEEEKNENVEKEIEEKNENVEKEIEEKNENIEIPEPPASLLEEIGTEETQIEREIETEETQIEREIETEKIQDELDKTDIENIQTELEKESDQKIKDPVRLFENFKPILNVAENKKSEILKGMIEYKTAQKLMERQEIKKDIDKIAIDIQILRQEYLAMLDVVKKDLKEVRESFLMSMLIILHNFSFMPLDKLPIFKNQKK